MQIAHGVKIIGKHFFVPPSKDGLEAVTNQLSVATDLFFLETSTSGYTCDYTDMDTGARVASD